MVYAVAIRDMDETTRTLLEIKGVMFKTYI